MKKAGDEMLILDLQTGQLLQLNSTAAWILAKCDGTDSIGSISREFSKEFGVDSEQAAEDVAATIEQLTRANILDEIPGLES